MTTDNPSEQTPSEKDPGSTDDIGQTENSESTDTTQPSNDATPSDSADDWQDPNEESDSSGCLKGIAGCAGAATILVLLIGIVVYFSWDYITDMAINQFTSMVKTRIDKSELSNDQKKKLKKRVGQIKTRFKNDEITLEQVENVVKKTRPLMSAATVQAVKQSHIAQADWSDQEKNEANRALDRFMRGLTEQKIKEKEFNTVIKPILTSGNEDNKTLKENPSDEDLKKFVQKARKHADKHDIPDKSFDFDVVSEFDKVLENTLTEEGKSKSAK